MHLGLRASVELPVANRQDRIQLLHLHDQPTTPSSASRFPGVHVARLRLKAARARSAVAETGLPSGRRVEPGVWSTAGEHTSGPVRRVHAEHGSTPSTSGARRHHWSVRSAREWASLAPRVDSVACSRSLGTVTASGGCPGLPCTARPAGLPRPGARSMVASKTARCRSGLRSTVSAPSSLVGSPGRPRDCQVASIHPAVSPPLTSVEWKSKMTPVIGVVAAGLPMLRP